MLCLRYSQFLFEIARGNGHETEFANGVEGAVRVVAVRENRYVAEHLVSSLYAQDRNYGTSPQPKASARIQIVTDTEVLEKRGFWKLPKILGRSLSPGFSGQAIEFLHILRIGIGPALLSERGKKLFG